MKLSELKTGEQGIISKVLGYGAFRRRIIEMGFIKGKTVDVLLNAPLKDPIKYKLMGYEVSLRRTEAEMIEVLPITEGEMMVSSPAWHGTINEITPIDREKRAQIEKRKRTTINVALVGNPNCGKTSLFNISSGAHEHVGNYSGVTVDAKIGEFEFQGYRFRLVDLPGTYSLSAFSPEELYVRKHIIEETPDIIINVVDAGNLERNLYLTTQLIDMDVRMVMALNMYDALENSGNELDITQLSRLLGMPIIPTVSRTGKGIDQLFHTIISLYEGADFMGQKEEIKAEAMKAFREWHDTYVPDHDFQHAHEHDDYFHEGSFIRSIQINHGPDLERCIETLQAAIERSSSLHTHYSTRFIAIKLLELDKDIEARAIRPLSDGIEILALRDRLAVKIQNLLGEDSEQAVTDAKYGFIAGALKETYTDHHKETNVLTKAIDAIVTHKWLGFPIFFFFLYLMFEVTFVLGEYPMQGIDWCVGLLEGWIQTQMADGILKDLLIDGVIGGVGGVIVFLPDILLLYFFISLMEDSGYMARAAFIMDKLMHKMGLHGKSFIPLIMGFGCNVPAVMASRIIESPKTRLVTMLVTPLMSCSARLPIYLVMIGAFFPENGSLVLFSIYVTGILLAVLLARIFSKFLVKGEDTPFVMELPPYRMPTPKSIFRHTWEKGRQYLRKMGGIILVASIIVWALSYFPRNEQYKTISEQQENSYIGQLGKIIEPVMKPLGYDWKMSVGIFSGLGAKEIVVSTLGVLYTNENLDADSVDLTGRIPATPLQAYSYMIFVLLYFPCLATLVAIRKESGKWKWAFFSAVYSTSLAWLMAFLIYQIGQLIL